jgi:hypothetical protein
MRTAPGPIAGGLRRRGVDVTTPPEVGLMGAMDEQQAAYSLAEGRVLFTQDEDFLRLDAATRASRIASRIPGPSARSSGASSSSGRCTSRKMTGRVEYL